MVRDYRKGGVTVYLANVSPGLKLSLEKLAENNLIAAFCDDDGNGKTQLEALRNNYLCENVQAALLRTKQ